MKYHIILNPKSAGGKTTGREDTILAAAEKHLGDVSISKTTRPGEATEIAAKASKEGAEAIIIVGGDGTINEVVNGIAPFGESAEDRPIVGIVPSGSGGDFCRTFGLTKSIEDAILRIAKGEPQLIDIGRIKYANRDDRFFANIASTGLSAEIGLNTNKAKWLKQISGDLAFNWTILTTTLRHRRFPLVMRSSIDPDGKSWDANCIAVCNGQYFGSGVRVAREADPGDGMLDIAVVHDLEPLGFLKGVTAIKKDDSNMPKGVTKFQAEWVEIDCEDESREVFIETDGEDGGLLPARFEVVPKALRLF